MKAIGIIRRIDDLGRIGIPKDMRRIMRISEGDALELVSMDAGILVTKYVPDDEELERAIRTVMAILTDELSEVPNEIHRDVADLMRRIKKVSKMEEQ